MLLDPLPTRIVGYAIRQQLKTRDDLRYTIDLVDRAHTYNRHRRERGLAD